MKTFMPKGISDADLRVAQEIKNHQDLMYEAHQKIQTLANGLAALAIQMERGLASSGSDNKEVLISFENLQGEVLERLDNFVQRLGDLESKCIQIQLDYGDKLYEFSQNYISKEEHVKSTAFLWGKFKELEEKINNKSGFIDSEFTRVKSQVNDQVADVRKEIPSVEEFKPIRKEMEEKFQTFKVDYDGLFREIKLLKKSVDYDQKKFENVYTLIERLKAEKE